jgi:hypothetical protein
MAAMNEEFKKLEDERKALLKKAQFDLDSAEVTFRPSVYHQLQARTRGYLLHLFFLALVGLACSILIFHQKAWYRVMLCFVECVVVHGKKFDLKICNPKQAPTTDGFPF